AAVTARVISKCPQRTRRSYDRVRSKCNGEGCFPEADVFGSCQEAGNAQEPGMTVEIETILRIEDLHTLLEAAEVSGSVRQSELQEVLEPLELEPLELDALYSELDRRGIEIADDPERGRDKVEAPPPAPLQTSYETTTEDRKSTRLN